MVRTESVPCDFVLVASGNIDTVKRMHPALRSRIRGYGYEIAVNHSMPDTMENRRKLVRFTGQEVAKDGKIPHFKRSAVLAIILEAKKRADRKNRLSLRLRDLGGLIRAAGDIAREEGVPFTEVRHVLSARGLARSLENQIADRREYFNDSVNTFNIRIEAFPDLFLAKVLGYQRRDLFEVPQDIRQPLDTSMG